MVDYICTAMMTLPHGPPVIDLTSIETYSPEESPVNVNLNHTQATQRKKRKRPSAAEETQLQALPFARPTEPSEALRLEEHAHKSEVNAEGGRSPTANSAGLNGSPQQFYVDLEPAVALNSNPPSYSASLSVEDNQTLLLPAHVSVFGTTAVEILPSFRADPDENDFIQYLDFDDQKVVSCASGLCWTCSFVF